MNNDILQKLNEQRTREEKQWLVSPIKKASRTLTNVMATAQNVSELARLESAKAVVESISELAPEEYNALQYVY